MLKPAAAAEPGRARVRMPCRVHGGGVPSRGLTWRTCSEASNNAIARFDPFKFDVDDQNFYLIVDGLRVLCAPHPRAAAAAAVAVASGSG